MERKFSELRELGKSLKPEWSPFKYPLYYLWLAGYVVTSRSLTQEVAGLNNPFCFLSMNSLN